jgi:alkaline phosphatase
MDFLLKCYVKYILKMKIILHLFLIAKLLVILNINKTIAQPMSHSHNDYLQSVPFWNAFGAGCNSVEADVFLKDEQLFVAHTKSEINTKTLRKTYLEPINELIINDELKGRELQLLIDIKTEANSTLNKIISEINDFPSLKNQDSPLKIIISGNRPKDFNGYPSFILFDYQETGEFEKIKFEKVGMVSYSFQRFSKWNGKGRLIHSDEAKLKEVIDKVHKSGKKIRFWASPDNPTAWFTLSEMGVDFINTDKPFDCTNYIKSLKSSLALNNYQKAIEKINHEKINRKGVFIVIGDGCGLAQWSSAMINSGPLHIEKIKNIGLSKTQAADEFTTDSAAGGTAIATGVKTNNRYIGKDPMGKSLPTLFEIIETKDFFKGIVTTDNIAGATPASFYAHVQERDSTIRITDFLNESSVNLMIGQATETQKNIITQKYNLTNPNDNNAELKGTKNAVLFDKIPYITEKRGDFLRNSTHLVLNEIARSNKDFIVMIENGHIDGAGHANKASETLNEVLDLDNTIGIIMDFIDKNPECTLIVTADHETGGATLPHADKKGNPEIRFHSDDHTGIPVPVFAYGAGASLFSGIYENTEIHKKILELVKKY